MIESDLLVFPITIPLIGSIVAGALRGKSGSYVTLAACVLTAVAGGMILHASSAGPTLVYRIGGWASPYGIVFVADLFAAVLALTASSIAAASALQTIIPGEHVAHQRLYNSLFLFTLAALNGVFLTGDLFNLYVFMELTILSSFGLVAMADRPVSPETTFKYAVISAIGSLMLLFGVSFVYAGVGTLNIADIADRVGRGGAPAYWNSAGAMIFVAFLIKAAVFPFHFWQPDAHSAAPSPVSAMLSSVLVKVGVYGIVRTSLLLFPDAPVVSLLAPLGAVSALFGALGALSNTNIKRALAYSTITNLGFILLAVGWGGQAGRTAVIVIVVVHALAKASLFLTGGYITHRLHEQSMERLGGLTQLTMNGTLAFGAGTVAIAGLPPLAGYLNKLTLLQAGLAAGDWTLLVVAAIAAALSIGYSARMFILVFWGKATKAARERWNEDATPGLQLPSLLLAVLYLGVGLWPGPLLDMATSTASQLGLPDSYISAVMGGEK